MIVLCILLFAVYVHSHALLKHPPARTEQDGLTLGPCGDAEFTSPDDGKLLISPGPLTVHYFTRISHSNTPFVILLSEDGRDDGDNCVILDHIPHSIGGSTDYYITVEIPDVQCDSCSLHFANPQPSSSSGCSYGECVAYYSCSQGFSITGSIPRGDYVCAGQPADWPTSFNGVEIDATPLYYEQTIAAWDENGLLTEAPERYQTIATDNPYDFDLCLVMDCGIGACMDSSASCDCSETGYNGTNCEIYLFDNECLSYPCERGVCHDTQDAPFQCDCADTKYVGEHCEILCEHGGTNGGDVCDCHGANGVGDYCQYFCHGGTSMNDSLTCNCTGTGYTGVHCDEEIDDCASSPCGANSYCEDKGLNNYTCTCNDDYYGDPCNVSVCLYGPCMHNGTCVLDERENKYSCDCLATGYHGQHCERMNPTMKCDSSPCMNNGKCNSTDDEGSVQCNCTDTGYEGDLCDERIVYGCDSSPCVNSGVCFNVDISDFTCDCSTTGFEGEVCSDCNACENGGICNGISPDLAHVNCICPVEFVGQNCSQSACNCSNDGVCSASGGNIPVCVCIYPWTGSKCEESLISLSSSDDHFHLTSTITSSSSSSNDIMLPQESSAPLAGVDTMWLMTIVAIIAVCFQ